MAALLNLSRVAALGLLGLGVVSLYVFGESNGFFPRVYETRSKNHLPTHSSWTTTTFDRNFTGFAPVDDMLGMLVIFFWPVVDGANPSTSLNGFVFGAQAVAAWVMIVLEGWRKGNRGRVISYATVWVLVVQSIGYAVIGPFYVLLYLLTSPLVTSNASLTPSALTIPEGLLSGIPFGTITGYIVPTIIVALPTPSVLSVYAKVIAIVVWQPYPVWATAYNYIWNAALWPKIQYRSESQALSSQIAILRNVYKFALAVSATGYIVGMTISVSTVLFPGLFTSAARAELHPANVFLAPSSFGDAKAATIAEGSKWFLVYDYAITAAAYLTWAIASRYSQSAVKATRDDSTWYDPLTLLSLVGKIALLGPYAAALTLIWERDELIFAQVPALEGKKTS